MHRWLLELYESLPVFIQRVLKCFGYCLFILLVLVAVTSIPLDYFQKIGLEPHDAIAYVNTIKRASLISIFPMFVSQFGVIKMKMPNSPTDNTDEEAEEASASGE